MLRIQLGGVTPEEAALTTEEQEALFDPHDEEWGENFNEWVHRLQIGADRGEIAIFAPSDRIKRPQVTSLGSYMKTEEAVRFCEQFGFEVARSLTGSNAMIGAPLVSAGTTRPATPTQPQRAIGHARVEPEKKGVLEAATTSSASDAVFLRPKEVMARTGLLSSTFYDRQNPKSKYYDPAFPKPRLLGERSRAVGYLEAEVNQWIADCPAARR